MADYEGCSDGNCILRDKQLHQHTNYGCRCLRDIPRDLRAAIARRIRGLQDEVRELQRDMDYTPLE